MQLSPQKPKEVVADAKEWIMQKAVRQSVSNNARQFNTTRSPPSSSTKLALLGVIALHVFTFRIDSHVICRTSLKDVAQSGPHKRLHRLSCTAMSVSNSHVSPSHPATWPHWHAALISQKSYNVLLVGSCELMWHHSNQTLPIMKQSWNIINHDYCN